MSSVNRVWKQNAMVRSPINVATSRIEFHGPGSSVAFCHRAALFMILVFDFLVDICNWFGWFYLPVSIDGCLCRWLWRHGHRSSEPPAVFFFSKPIFSVNLSFSKQTLHLENVACWTENPMQQSRIFHGYLLLRYDWKMEVWPATWFQAMHTSIFQANFLH